MKTTTLNRRLARQVFEASADVLNVAILEQLNPDLFVSGDKAQIVLAKARGFNCGTFY